jgi:hypothetical protein
MGSERQIRSTSVLLVPKFSCRTRSENEENLWATALVELWIDVRIRDHGKRVSNPLHWVLRHPRSGG